MILHTAEGGGATCRLVDSRGQRKKMARRCWGNTKRAVRGAGLFKDRQATGYKWVACMLFIQYYANENR